MPTFQHLEEAPPDAILGLNDAFAKDSTPGKINLGVGVYKDAEGKTPVLRSVKLAEEILLREESSKGYLPIEGSPAFREAVLEMAFGRGSEVVASGRSAVLHTPGGTGALRVAADFLARSFPGTKVWVSQPTWPNHPQIFNAAGIAVDVYPYFDPVRNGLEAEAFLSALGAIPSGQVVLLHGCCHNPSGADPSPELWAQVAAICLDRRLVPLIDFAYQGFGDGLEEDAACLRAFAAHPELEFLVASSFSKNFGLYSERVGTLTVVTADAGTAQRVLSQVKQVVRANYSNPASHGGAIVSAILLRPELRQMWEVELAAMRDRINNMRAALVDTLREVGVERDFSFIRRQKGMFSFSGLNKDQVAALRARHAIYIVGSGRINVAGITPSNVHPLCRAIQSVL